VNFLDEHPQDWTRPELPQLRDLFVLAYKRPSAAEELADSAGIVPGTFPMYPNMRTTWYELIRVMGDQGKLRAMVEKAAADPTTGAFQQRFAEMLEGKPTVPVPTPTKGADWWKGDDVNPILARRLYQERLIEQRSRLIHIEIARQVAEVSRSVAMLTLRFANELAHGTGFLIQPDLILTNHHNVSDARFGDIQSVTVEFDYEQGFDRKRKPLVRRGLIESIVKNEAHDWAVVRLDKPVDRKPVPLGTPYDVGKDDPIIIIEHPLGSFKQFALDMLSIRYADDQLVQYLADTQKGSSGSPVFNIKMQVIALHHAEAEVTVQVDGREEVEWRNEGIRIEQVMKDLKAEGIKFDTN
jgi:S1-C subfamily serine protease